ncbi:NIF3-like protein 1 isoform X2 [Neocloeon triangulifer]|nr:NIF3-like protein 1 isoform X2 [Neocloeon triangulifer]
MMARSGLPLREVVQRLNNLAPLWLAESWDNVGLLLETYQSSSTPVKELLLTNDLTEDVAQEAISKNIQLIISYHPPLFRPFKTITNDQWKSRIISTCMAHNMSVYSPHTCYDSIYFGVNDWLASVFDFETKKPVLPAKCPAGVETSLDLASCGAGRLMELKSPITISTAVEKIKSKLKLDHVHLALAKGASKDSTISSVAVCAGSGSSVLAGVNAELLLTGEMSHHEVLDAVHNGKSVILTWHSNSERGFLVNLADILTSKTFKNEE